MSKNETSNIKSNSAEVKWNPLYNSPAEALIADLLLNNIPVYHLISVFNKIETNSIFSNDKFVEVWNNSKTEELRASDWLRFCYQYGKESHIYKIVQSEFDFSDYKLLLNNAMGN